ncbi:hypothetical protein IWX49DRAFT_572690 [Phyllosticta citricarpa]|uniref:Secreted protein n=1 Tax=Phyllosticta citricarpa TaxID=55181 RepID=A0ABR1MRM8_9PEZI
MGPFGPFLCAATFFFSASYSMLFPLCPFFLPAGTSSSLPFTFQNQSRVAYVSHCFDVCLCRSVMVVDATGKA